MVTLKTAHNRGNSRIWLDRKSCETLAIRHGERFTVTFEPDVILLNFRPDPKAKGIRRVAGSPTRPVVDICSRKVGPSLGEADRYTVQRLGTSYMIRGVA